MVLIVSSNFDSGNGEVVSVSENTVQISELFLTSIFLILSQFTRPHFIWLYKFNIFFVGSYTEIRNDPPTQQENKTFKQWFNFRVSNCPQEVPLHVSIVNAGDTSYPSGWPGYNVSTSYDRINWFRTPCTFDGNGLNWTIVPDRGTTLYFAYFAPYVSQFYHFRLPVTLFIFIPFQSLERHFDLLAKCSSQGVSMKTLGLTIDGRPLDMLTFGNGPRK